MLENFTKFPVGKLSSLEVISKTHHGEWKTPLSPVNLGLRTLKAEIHSYYMPFKH